MLRPRFSIGRLMAVVTLAAANFAVFRACFVVGDIEAIALFGVLAPILNLLLIGLVLLLVRLVREGQSSAFWLGFVVFGFAGILVYAADLAVGGEVVSCWNAIAGLLGAQGWDIEWSPTWPWLGLLAALIIPSFLSLPLVLFAVLGGCLTRKFGIMVVRRRSSEAPRDGALA